LSLQLFIDVHRVVAPSSITSVTVNG